MRTPDQLCETLLSATDDGAAIVARGREAFMEDRLLQRAAKNVLAEIGEAAGNLPEEVLVQIGPMPWGQITGIRDKVVHDYYELDLVIMWTTLETDLPELGNHVRLWLAAR